MGDLTNNASDEAADRYLGQLETALMSAALADITDGRQRAALLSQWIVGTFNAASYGLAPGEKPGALAWGPDGSGHALIWLSPTGLACHLGKVYEQPNGTWAALVVAGAGDGAIEAMGRVEWAVCRLTG